MISPKVNTITTTVKRYVIESPANWKDVGDVLNQIQQDPDLRNGQYDDAVKVIARDDEIHFEFSVRNPDPRA